jgi:hypothetical protein
LALPAQKIVGLPFAKSVKPCQAPARQTLQLHRVVGVAETAGQQALGAVGRHERLWVVVALEFPVGQRKPGTTRALELPAAEEDMATAAITMATAVEMKSESFM